MSTTTSIDQRDELQRHRHWCLTAASSFGLFFQMSAFRACETLGNFMVQRSSPLGKILTKNSGLKWSSHRRADHPTDPTDAFASKHSHLAYHMEGARQSSITRLTSVPLAGYIASRPATSIPNLPRLNASASRRVSSAESVTTI